MVAAGHQIIGQIEHLTARIEELIAAIPAACGIDANGATGPDAAGGPDAPVLPALARLDTRHGAAIWSGHGVLTRNLVKIATLAS
jgi:hypothetical protein